MCNQSLWPNVVRSRFSNAGLASPLVFRCTVCKPTVLMFRRYLACRHSSLRRLLVPVVDDGENA